MGNQLCTYCLHNPAVMTVDGQAYCSWDCAEDDYLDKRRKEQRRDQ